MESEFGTEPKGGFAGMVPEFHVTDIDKSLEFWLSILGFTIAYQRPAEKFVYLEHVCGAQVMLCQRHGAWETGAMEVPYGRGILFQIFANSIESVVVAVNNQAWPIHTGPREVWRRQGTIEACNSEIVLQDPDGYLIMVSAQTAVRPA